VSTKVLLALDGDDWACMCWSARGMSGHKSARPPKGLLYPFSACTLTCVKSLVTCVESVFATITERFTIADCFLLF
jgi:hypothetical protein